MKHVMAIKADDRLIVALDFHTMEDVKSLEMCIRDRDVTLPTAITSFSKTGSDGKTYAYSTATAADCANQTMTQYYSFFTVDDSGSRTYYYLSLIHI